MKRIKRLVTLLATVFIALGTVQAQSGDPAALNITTSPLPISLVAKPGETVNTELRVKNSGLKTEVLKVGLMKFSAFGEAGQPQLEDRAAGDDYFDWVKFSETQFTAEPNEWHALQMTIAVPPTAAFGYYYAVTFSRANPEQPSDQRSTVVRGGTATLVLLEVDSPNAQRVLKLTDFSVTKRTYEFLPAEFQIKLSNEGNIHSVPSGTIYIRRGDKQIDIVNVNEAKGNILPDSGRVFSAKWTNGFPVYEAKVQNDNVVLNSDGGTEQVLSWKANQIKNIRFGKYTAYLTMVYDDGQRDVPLDASVEFWVIPWRALLVLVGIPLLLTVLIVYLLVSRWRYKNKTIRFRQP